MEERKEPDSLLPSKATLELDGRELELATAILAGKASQLYLDGKSFEADQLFLLALKFKKAKKEFHEMYQNYFAERYGLNNEEKSAGGQTSQGNI